jgi:dephospho-CoA kinase
LRGEVTRLLVVGIAGGSGTGKSTVADHIAKRLGGTHIDADRVAHAVLDDAAVTGKIRDEFGRDVADADGRINRHRLGARVFAEADARRRLNGIVHPAIIRRCADGVAAARARGDRVVVVDAALLLEVEMSFDFDLTIALHCDRDVRLARIMGKGGWNEAEIRARLDAQEGMEKHFYKADAVVDTGRDLAAVLAEIDGLVDAALRSESH